MPKRLRRVLNTCLVCGFLCTSGCLDLAAQRGVAIHQISANTSERHFVVDTSQIPPDWIQGRTVVQQGWGDELTIQLRPQHQVKILLVPLPEQGTPTSQP